MGQGEAVFTWQAVMWQYNKTPLVVRAMSRRSFIRRMLEEMAYNEEGIKEVKKRRD